MIKRSHEDDEVTTNSGDTFASLEISSYKLQSSDEINESNTGCKNVFADQHIASFVSGMNQRHMTTSKCRLLRWQQGE